MGCVATRSRRHFLGSAAVALTALWGSPAHAQLAAAPETTSAATAEADTETSSAAETGEIIVTAQRLQQSLQDVPLAITAFSGRLLEERQVVNMQDIADYVPGLKIDENLSNTSTPKLFLRGIGVDNSAFSFDSPIGIYVDDVYFARAIGSMVDFFDIERVEVLRGPQGTIYGRNSSIGAVRIITKRPPLDTADLKAEVRYGTRNQFNVNVAAGVPLVPDRVGLRIAFNHKQNDGFQVNLLNGERVKRDDINAFRAQLLFQPTSDLSITLRGDYLRDRSRETAASNFLIKDDDDLLTFISNKTYEDGTAINELDTYGLSGTINWRVGAVDLTSITAWRGIDTKKAFDADGRNAAIFEVDRSDLRQRQFTQEIFASANDIGTLPIAWVVGGFYLREPNEYVYSNRVISAPSVNFFEQTLDSAAAYAQGIWRATDRLSLTAGIRYTTETKDFDATGVTATGAPLYTFSANNLEIDKWTWRLAADYRLSDEALLFFSASTGFRSGGLNGNATNLAGVTSGGYGPEETLMYEGGVKLSFLDRRLIVNGSYYWGKYSGLQQAVTLSNGLVSSVNNNARVNGIDLEILARPVRGLSLSATAATFNSDIENSELILKESPDLEYSLAANYSLPTEVGVFGVGATYSWTDKAFANTANTAILVIPEHETVNAYVSYELPDRRWKLTGGVYNLTNDIYPLGGFFIAGGNIAAVQWPSLPRRYYVSAQYTF